MIQPLAYIIAVDHYRHPPPRTLIFYFFVVDVFSFVFGDYFFPGRSSFLRARG
jgi:hypothetical protein